MKRVLLALLILGSTSLYGWTGTKNYLQDSKCEIITGSDNAFTVYTSSYPGTKYVAFKVFTSSVGLVLGSTVVINMAGATADTYDELITSINAQANWYATPVPDVDGSQASYGSGTTGMDGMDFGLLGSSAPKVYTDCYTSSNAATVLFNATTTRTKKFSPDKNRRVACTQVISSSTASNIKVEFLDGVSTSAVTNTVALPVFTDDKRYKNVSFSEQCPVASTSTNRAFGFKVTASSWITTNDKVEIHYYTGE